MPLSLATGACHDLAIAPFTGKAALLRQASAAQSPGDVVVADAPCDNSARLASVAEIHESG